MRLTNLRAGQLDLIERLAPTDLAQVKRDPKLKVGQAYELGFSGIVFNTAREGSPVADPRVRAAFEAAIDRNAITQVVYNASTWPGTSGSRRRTRTTSPSIRCRSATSPRPRRS